VAEDLVTTTVTVLGTGIMGAGMARNLLAAGLDVTVWNRTPDRARPLGDAGARVATDPAEAVSGCDVVVTMLWDAESTVNVMERALPAVSPRGVWAQCATVGLGDTERLADLAARHGVGFVDAPVLGTRKPAEEGTLTVLAGGPPALREAVAPVFDAVGSRTVWVGERPGDGHTLKLVVNSWVESVMAGTAQAVALAEGLGLDPGRFLDTIRGGPMDCAYAQIKGAAMIAGELPPAFTLSGAAKDAGLIVSAMRGAGVNSGVMEAVLAACRAGEEAGHGDKDMAALIHYFRPRP
jgi:3-hydroxyisobutyrate dehydrogenase